MIDKEKFNVLNYVKMEEYTGSMDGMRYMLKAMGKEEFEAIIWPEPNAYAYTEEKLKTRKRFPLTREGIEDVADYLNEFYLQNKDLWELSKR